MGDWGATRVEARVRRIGIRRCIARKRLQAWQSHREAAAEAPDCVLLSSPTEMFATETNVRNRAPTYVASTL